jgi:formiminotetrahydrofolate cyclodeaminase
VLINLKDMKDPAYVAEKRAACESLLVQARALAEEAARVVDDRLVAMIEKR